MEYWYIYFVAKTARERTDCAGHIILSYDGKNFSKKRAAKFILKKADTKMTDLEIVISEKVTEDDYNKYNATAI